MILLTLLLIGSAPSLLDRILPEPPPGAYLVLTPERFKTAIEPLTRHRAGLGHATEIAIVADATPESLRAEVEKRWRASGKTLRYVLLAGPYTERPAAQLPKLSYGQKYAVHRKKTYPSDLPLSLGGRVPVGRIPADTPEQLATLVQKIIRYETAPAEGEWRRRLAVWTGPARYGKLIDTIIEQTGRHLLDKVVPPKWDISFLFAKQDHTHAYPAPILGAKLIDVLNRGALLAAYVGHGNIQSFDGIRHRGRRYNIGTVREAEEMAIRSGAPFFVVLACLTGAFDDFYGTAIGEAMVRNPNGPVAVLAASRVVHPYTNGLWAKAFTDVFITSRAKTVGDGLLALRARAPHHRIPMVELWQKLDGAELMAEQNGLYNLMGDPATRLRYPLEANVSIRSAVRAGQDVTVAIQAPGIKFGTLIVARETRRSLIRGRQIDAAQLGRLGDSEFLQAMAQNYAVAVEKTEWETTIQIRDGYAEVQVPFPTFADQVIVKALVLGEGETAAGATRVALNAAAECPAVPQLRAKVTRRGGGETVWAQTHPLGELGWAVPLSARTTTDLDLVWMLMQMDKKGCAAHVATYGGLKDPVVVDKTSFRATGVRLAGQVRASEYIYKRVDTGYVPIKDTSQAY